MKPKTLIQLFIGVAISGLALWLVFRDIRLSDLVDSFRAFDMKYLLPSMFVFYAVMWIRGWRWALLFKPQYDISLNRAVSGMFICFGLNSVLPARAGEVARAYYVGKRDRTGFSTAFATVVAERLLDSLTLLPCLALALMVAPIDEQAEFSIRLFGEEPVRLTGARFMELKNSVVTMAVVLLVGIVALAVPALRRFALGILQRLPLVPQTFKDKIEGIVEDFARGLKALHDPRRVVLLFLLSLTVWAAGALSCQILAWGFPMDRKMGFVQAFAMMVITCIFIIPAAPGYWGLFEAGIVFSIMVMGIHGEQSLVLSYAILLHLTQWLPIVLIGLPLSWRAHISMSDIHEAEDKAGNIP